MAADAKPRWAGRSAFITGQSVFRTGLSKVGVPGSSIRLHDEG